MQITFEECLLLHGSQISSFRLVFKTLKYTELQVCLLFLMGV
jgi:hypothetical protein